MVFLILTLQFVTSIFHGCNQENSFPNRHYQGYTLKKTKQTQKRKQKPNKNEPKKTNPTNPNPENPTRNYNTSDDVPFRVVFETNC